jgi:hemin uptake protein HemP
MPDMDEERNLPPQPGRTEAPAARTVESRELLGEATEVVIRHEGRLYRLRRTRAGKLILTA